MELNEDQKARAQAMADAVGADPVKYFGDALKEATRKGNERLTSLIANAKLKLGEKYTQVGQQAGQSKVNLEIVREAYRIWYEKNGKDLVTEKKFELKALFDDGIAKFETLLTTLKKDAQEIVDILTKKEDEGSEGK
ncbi:MAG TPA: hypothetical protein PLI45_05085 [Candidatus Woesebacteria bacterium]|nr:hypothetical protein [Candidatus Woesebacteria bacterium]